MDGSLEDLWPFNEEIVAHSIYNSEIPIISAVGHETDFSISDFVADLRAPTPSAAAELAVPDIYDVKQKIDSSRNRLKMALTKKLEFMKLRYEKSMSSSVFREPTRRINENYIKLDMIIKHLENMIKEKTNRATSKYTELVSKLDMLSPLKTLTRGYSIIQKNTGIVKSVKDLQKGDSIKIRLSDGEAEAQIINS